MAKANSTTFSMTLDNGLVVSLAVSAPYAVGQKITTSGEAHALNQTRRENIGNLLRKSIKEADNQSEAQGLVDKLDTTYVFGVSAGRVTDPIVKQMAIVASHWAKAELKADGKPTDIKAVKAKAAEIMIEREDEMRARAVKIVALLADDDLVE